MMKILQFLIYHKVFSQRGFLWHILYFIRKVYYNITLYINILNYWNLIMKVVLRFLVYSEKKYIQPKRFHTIRKNDYFLTLWDTWIKLAISYTACIVHNTYSHSYKYELLPHYTNYVIFGRHFQVSTQHNCISLIIGRNIIL